MARNFARNVALAAVIGAGSASLALAQPRMNRGPNPDAPKLMVSACKSAGDKVLATLCADKIRSQIEGDVSFRNLLVMSKADVENTLTASGYDPAIALASGDAIALAKQLHADMYVDAMVEKAGAGYKITAAVVLARDANMKQPLGTFDHARIETVSSQISKAFQDVFNKTYDKQKDCFTRERERKYDEANKAVADGMKDFPESMWLRHCKLALLKDRKAPGAEVAAVLEEIVKSDPANKAALRDLVIIYDTEGNSAKKLATLQALLAADPTDTKLIADIINEYAKDGKFAEARPIAEKAVAEYPGEISIVRPYWLIVMTLKDYKLAIDVGKKMAAMDTSTADTSYYYKMISAANADSNFTEAADLARKAAAKFSQIEDFHTYAVALYRKAGDNAASVAAARRALTAIPNMKGLRVQIGVALLAGKTEAGADSAVALVREMIAKGEDKREVAAIAVSAGDVLRQMPEKVKAAGGDAAAQKASAKKAYDELAWADTLAKGTDLAPQAKFLRGVAALTLGQMLLQEAGPAKSCELTNAANDYFVEAQLAAPIGAQFAAEASRQIMAQAMQMSTQYVEPMKKAYCKP